MRMLQFLGAILVLISSPAMAKDAVSSWIVTQKSGEVRVLRSGLQPASVQVRAALSPGDVIATGPNGRAIITKDEDYVVVAPSSRLTLPKEQQQTGFTRLIQSVGTMLYKVKRTGVPHFSVETPMLAAVVKGTTFTVVVDKDRAAVQVTEGIVEVSSVSGDAKRLVEGGATVYVGRERPNDILDVKSDSTRLPGSGNDEPVKIEGSSDVSLAAITDLTGGLVREAPVVAAVPIANAGPVAPANPAPVPTTGLPPAVPTDVIAPVTDIVETTVPAVVDPVVDIVQTTVPAVTDPVVDIVQTTIPAVVEPVVDIVETTIPAVVEPVVDIVQTTLPVVTEPVVDIIETTVPNIIDPVVDIVQTTIPAITEPVVDIVETTVPAVTEPVGGIIQTIVSPVLGLLGGK